MLNFDNAEKAMRERASEIGFVVDRVGVSFDITRAEFVPICIYHNDEGIYGTMVCRLSNPVVIVGEPCISSLDRTVRLTCIED